MPSAGSYELAEHVPVDEIDDEITEKLDAIVRVAQGATDKLPSIHPPGQFEASF